MKYLTRAKNQLLLASSGALVSFSTPPQSSIEDTDKPFNNHSVAWFRGTSWLVGSVNADTHSSAKIEISNNLTIAEDTEIIIDGYTIKEGTDWFIELSAIETIISIKTAIQANSYLNALINVYQEETILFLKSKLAGLDKNFSLYVSSLSGLKVNEQNVIANTSFEGGTNLGTNFRIFRLATLAVAYEEVFNEDSNVYYPTSAGLPKSVALYQTGDKLIYCYFKENWDQSKLIFGYRIFETVQSNILSAQNYEVSLAVDPTKYFSIADIIDFKGQLFVSIISNQGLVTRIFKFLPGYTPTEVIDLTSHTGYSAQFLFWQSQLYSFSSSGTQISIYDELQAKFIAAGNLQTISPINSAAKIGVAALNDSSIYLAYTATPNQGTLIKIIDLNNNIPFTTLTTFGTLGEIQYPTVIEDIDPSTPDQVWLLSQTSGNQANLYSINSSDILTLQDTVIAIQGTAGLQPYITSAPDTQIDEIVTSFTGLVTINYRTYDVESDPVTVIFEYSDDAGLTWNAGTIETVDQGTISGNQILNVTTLQENKYASVGNGGQAHFLEWNAKDDLGSIINENIRIRLRTFTALP